MKIYVGSDHRGFELKKDLIEYLKKSGYDVEDAGNERLEPEDDFPIFAAKVVTKLKTSNDADPRGILLCGSGQGMCVAANRFKGIRAALGWSREAAKESRNDDDSNVLCLPADVFDAKKAEAIVQAWLNTPFAGAPRFVRRNHLLDELA